MDMRINEAMTIHKFHSTDRNVDNLDTVTHICDSKSILNPYKTVEMSDNEWKCICICMHRSHISKIRWLENVIQAVNAYVFAHILKMLIINEFIWNRREKPKASNKRNEKVHWMDWTVETVQTKKIDKQLDLQLIHCNCFSFC